MHPATPALAAAAAAPLAGDDAYDDIEQGHDGLCDEDDHAEDGIDHHHDGTADHGAEVGQAGEDGTHDVGVAVLCASKRWLEG